MPTGSGKSRTFAVQAARHIQLNPDGRVVILVHTDELADQAYRTVRAVAPHIQVGIVKALRDEVRARIIIASKQTLDRPARRARIKGVSFVIIDECDLALATNGYGASVREFGGFDAKVPVAGYTATLVRADNEALRDIWQTVAYRRDILWMINKHYLVDIRGIQVKVDDLELKRVKRQGGDFQDTSLADALTDSMAPEVVAKAYLEHAADRKGLLFTPNVASAYIFADALIAQGIVAEVVHGGLPKRERRAILARLKSGETQVVCNCAVLTVGFDEPTVSCIAMCRPTKSKRLYQQIVGRGARLDPALPWEEQDCLLLDMVGASASHDLRSLVDLSEKDLKPRDGQSLLEAEEEGDRGDGAGAAEEKALWRGPVKVKEFDPLMRASRRTWGTTEGGARYLAAGDLYVTLMPTSDPDAPDDYWDVCWVGSRTGAGRTEHVAMPADMAMEWGESVADEHGQAVLNTKGKAWRRLPISDKQRARWSFLIEEGMRRGELSDAIDAHAATRRIDPQYAIYMRYLDERGL
jgi:superfamily II DNA or RNA helicase